MVVYDVDLWYLNSISTLLKLSQAFWIQKSILEMDESSTGWSLVINAIPETHCCIRLILFHSKLVDMSIHIDLVLHLNVLIFRNKIHFSVVIQMEESP